LRYGSATDSDWSAWVLVARVGRANKRAFGIQFIIDRTISNSAAMIDAVVAELDFYLVKLGEPNPWDYARYHCGTSSNLHSSVHWSFCAGQRKDVLASKAT
jgi:hypothetical protein